MVSSVLNLLRILIWSVCLVLVSGCKDSEQNCDPSLTCGCEAKTADCALTEQEILQNALQQNREKWQDLAANEYSFDVSISCFCPEALNFSVYASNNEFLIFDNTNEIFINSIWNADTDSLHSPEALFRFIDDYIWEADQLTVEFDAETGLPKKINLDPDFNIADEEVQIEITKINATGLTVCADNVVPGIEVSVLEQGTQNNLSCDAAVHVYNELHSEYLNQTNCSDQGFLSGLNEKAGRFSAVIEMDGFQATTIDNVEIMRDFCHVITRSLQVELVKIN